MTTNRILEEPTNNRSDVDKAAQLDTAPAGEQITADVVETNPDTALNPFDPANLRIDQDFVGAVPIKAHLTEVPFDKPHRQEFFRVQPGDEWRLNAAVFECNADGEKYIIHPSLVSALGEDVKRVLILTIITRQGVVKLWPCKVPGLDGGGRGDSWHRSALEAAKMAETTWVKMVAVRHAGYYRIEEPLAKLPEPEWPEYTFPQILEIAFRNRFIDSLDHPVIKALHFRRNLPLSPKCYL